MADPESSTGPAAPAPQAVTYCAICSYPPEYCEFGESLTRCKAWLEKTHPDLHAKLWSDEAISQNLAALSTKQAEDLEKEAVKKEKKAEAKAEKEKAQKAVSMRSMDVGTFGGNAQPAQTASCDAQILRCAKGLQSYSSNRPAGAYSVRFDALP